MSYARIILVTDPAFDDDRIVRCVDHAGRALPPGGLCVQLRDKERPRATVQALAIRLRQITRDCGAALVINGDAIIARAAEADGVHLGRGAGTPWEVRRTCGAHTWISVAAHSDDAVCLAIASEADAVLVSPVFPTRSPSPGGPPPQKAPRGVGALRSARALAGHRVLVYALGGVNAGNASLCREAGADGVAVVRALLASEDPACIARVLHDALSARC
ncbi:MAG: thiamine phosphate synthase [Myxococcota bacterium]|nr:thiamine phosphate synthase [Myxococcota bacterium]